MLEIKTFVFNPIQENTYLVWDNTGECAIIDAGCSTKSEEDKLFRFIEENNLRPIKLINTHCHFDHILGIEACRKKYNLKWEAHPSDGFLVDMAPTQGAMFGFSINPVHKPERELFEGEKIILGETELYVIHVPGHSPGSVCLYFETDAVLLTGDVLFHGSIGRTDLPMGNYGELIAGIKGKLLTLPENVTVYPGHGPATNIGDEKIRNPFLQ